MSGWLTREEALATLSVRPQTLYAYVSRGLILRRADPDDPRRSLYKQADVAGLRAKRDRGKRASSIAASTISWGEPIISTAISTVAGERLYYRGHDVVQLAEGASLEETAQILWSASRAPVFDTAPQSASPAAPSEAPRRLLLFDRLAGAAALGPATLNRAPAIIVNEAQGLIALVAQAIGVHGAGNVPLHERLAAGWGLHPSEADLLRRALVLRADQELNTSTFATRVAASTGAGLASCLLAGLAALSGPLHGDAADQIQAVMDEAKRTSVARTIARYRESAREIPGFGHRLYPDGDPRAIALLASFPMPRRHRAVADEVRRTMGLAPNLDFAVAGLAAHLALPADAPFCLFVMARSVGWIAHVMEQVAQPGLIRPRARYEGPALGR